MMARFDLTGESNRAIPLNYFTDIVTYFNRLQLFRSRLANIFATRMQDEEQIFLTELLQLINEGLTTDSLFGTAEATDACQVMQDNEELMISDGIVYKI